MTLFSDLDPLPLPPGVSALSPVFCFSDAHGGSAILRAAIRDALSGPETVTLAFLGDMTNRGFDSLGCVRAVLETMDAGVPVISIMGNHCQILNMAINHGMKEAFTFLEEHGGVWALDMIRKAEEGDPESVTALGDVRRWLGSMLGYKVMNGKGGSRILLTHAVPPNKRIADCSGKELRWSHPEKSFMRSGSRLFSGLPGVHIHGHCSRENPRGGPAALQNHMERMMRSQARLNIDGGMPFSSRLIRAEIRENHIHIRLFGKGAV